jgi:hypothetical protein
MVHARHVADQVPQVMQFLQELQMWYTGADPGHGEPGASGAVAGTGPAREEAGTSVTSRTAGPARVGLSAGADRDAGTWFVLVTREADAEPSTCCCTHEPKTGNGKQVGELSISGLVLFPENDSGRSRVSDVYRAPALVPREAKGTAFSSNITS